MLHWPDMKILVTNDDGVLADGLWALASELQHLGEVAVVAPDREQSAIGTALTLTQPLRVQKITSPAAGIETYAVQGTPGDGVILALERLLRGQVDIVVSGINAGLNVGTDVLISGTVGAALQGYLRGLSAVAISMSGAEPRHLAAAARAGRLLVERIRATPPAPPVFLNVNVPNRGPGEAAGVRVTRLAAASHIDTVEEGHDGKRSYYWLVRKRQPDRTHSEMTDIRAVEQGYVSLTPLHIYDDVVYGDAVDPSAGDGFCSAVLCADLAGQLAGGD
jgi:5'-nucleotidase